MLYVRWHKTSTSITPSSANERADHYEIAVEPAQPLLTGLHVRLMLVSDTRLHTPTLHLETPSYDAYDLFIEGSLEQTTSLSLDVTTYKVENKVSWNEIKQAFITTPSSPNPPPLSLAEIYWDSRAGTYAQASLKRQEIAPLSSVTAHALPAQAPVSPYSNYKTREEMNDDEIGAGDTVAAIRKSVGYWPTGPHTLFGMERAIGP